MKDALLQLLSGHASRELLLASSLGLLLCLLFLLFLWLLFRKKPRASDIGLLRVETDFTEDPVSDERREPDAGPELAEDTTPDPLESAESPITGTQVFERVIEP
ncbi:hypothetical protein EVA_16170, partial [gut metagenome]